MGQGRGADHRHALPAAVDIPGHPPIVLYKNNTDNKGASYGAHENYLMQRSTPFPDIVRHLTPFFVSRQVICGAGRVGIGQDGSEHGFQISQRADYFEVEVGLETTLKRPIINTRDEPHADPEKYRRLHVIIGDANLSEISTYLKVGTTALVLAMIEDRAISADFAIDGPGRARCTRSPTTRAEAHGQAQGRSRHDRARAAGGVPRAGAKYVNDTLGDDVDDQTDDVLRRWERDARPAAPRPDGAAHAARLGRQAGAARVATATATASTGTAPSCTWSTCSTPTCVRTRASTTSWCSRARMERLLTDDEVAGAVTNPPEDTRAYFRGRCLAQYPDRIAAASWDSVIFDLPGRDSLQRIPTMEPSRGTRQHVGGCWTAARRPRSCSPPSPA